MSIGRYFPPVCILCSFAALSSGADDAVSCKQTDEILAELRQLRALIERQPTIQSRAPSAPLAAPATTVSVGTAPFLGSKDAALVIVEFTDFQCPYCNRFFKETFPELKKNYIDTERSGFTAWIFRSKSIQTR